MEPRYKHLMHTTTNAAGDRVHLNLWLVASGRWGSLEEQTAIGGRARGAGPIAMTLRELMTYKANKEAPKMTKEQTKAALVAKAGAALAIARQFPSAKSKEAAVKASAELSAWVAANDPPKARGMASRAGARQAAERRALHTGRRR